MAREIKFRAWNKILKEMLESIQLADKFQEYLEEPWELNQYVGIKDKNGREIFESDILQLDGGAEPINIEVVFSDGAFRAKVPWLKNNHPQLLAYTIFEDLEEGKTFKDCVVVKIIGNIYENPELLGKGE